MLNEGTELRHNHGYEILRLLSEKGGMGLVYQAIDLNMRAEVVIKQSRYNDGAFLRRIFPNLSVQQVHDQAEMLRSAFEREARLLFGLRHNTLPRALNYFKTDSGDQFFVMEFIPGKDLGELLEEQMAEKRGPFSLGDVLRWADQLLDVLNYLHTEFPSPIIHRDIKPQNLKRMPNGQIVLLDFGLAKGAHPGMTLVAKSIPGHTLNYSSLEQIGGRGTNVRSDLYSLAVTLYQLMTGEAPPNAAARAANERSDPLRPAHEIYREIPVEISEVLHHAAALREENRYASAAEMRAALLHAAVAPPDEEATIVRPRWQSFVEELGNGVKLEMVSIPAGSSMMGAPKGKGFAAERPQHLVKLSPFFIGKYPVTQAQWQAIMGVNPSNFKGYNLPVENVSWHDAVEFCRALSQRTGRAYRLLTEAEWEYACRARSAGEYSFGDGEGLLPQHAWYGRNSDQQTHPVGQKTPNGWGLHDMHGNVWEWCWDWHDENYYGQGPETDPQGPASGKARTLRGGSWSDDSYSCRAAYRNSGGPFNRSIIVGFRVGLSAKL